MPSNEKLIVHLNGCLMVHMENDLHTVPGWVWTRTPPPAEAKLAPSVKWCAIGCKYGGSIGNLANWAAAIERKKNVTI